MHHRQQDWPFPPLWPINYKGVVCKKKKKRESERQWLGKTSIKWPSGFEPELLAAGSRWSLLAGPRKWLELEKKNE